MEATSPCKRRSNVTAGNMIRVNSHLQSCLRYIYVIISNYMYLLFLKIWWLNLINGSQPKEVYYLMFFYNFNMFNLIETYNILYFRDNRLYSLEAIIYWSNYIKIIKNPSKNIPSLFTKFRHYPPKWDWTLLYKYRKYQKPDIG